MVGALQHQLHFELPGFSCEERTSIFLKQDISTQSVCSGLTVIVENIRRGIQNF
jgi:hypothetical protein